MQLHVHSQIAHTAKTAANGKWRAPDSLGYTEYVGAVAAIMSQHLEEALSGRFGVEWVARDDGHGFEIKGISGEMMRVFSSRRESITADLRARAARFERRYGRKPSQREMTQLAQASNFTTRAAKSETLDVTQLHTGWADKLARTLGVPLASVAPSVWHNTRGHAAMRTQSPDGPVFTELELARAAQKAVALAQQDKSAWTRADVIKYLGRVLPRSGRDPAAATVLLEDLADRALRSEFDPVTCLEAAEAVQAPTSLLRADGRSIYQRHGGVRYATGAQLAMEERMLARARANGAPRLTRAHAAHALGADPAHLQDTLTGHARDTHDARTQSGLREDQAAAALSVLTYGQRVSVINAPPWSGKTRVLAEAARAWTAAGLGPVIGITPSQSARNTLAAGVPVSYSTAQFLGHLPGRRGARGPVPIGPGTLLVIDEASMISGPDLADLIAYAAARGAKIILAGDTSQLQAVENGGGMSCSPAPSATPAHRAGPVPRRLGTGSQPAPARRRHFGARRVRPARPDGRRGTRADDRRRRGRLRCAHRGRHRHAADDRRPRAAPRAVPPHPRRPDQPRHRPDRSRGLHRRRHQGQPWRPDHLHQMGPCRRGGGARPDAGQRRPAPHRNRHPRRPDRAPGPGRRPGHRAAALDRPALPVRQLQKF
jgi:hypothetical protein